MARFLSVGGASSLIVSKNSCTIRMKSFVDLSYSLGLPAVIGENRNAWTPNLTSTVIIVFQLQHLRSYSGLGSSKPD